MKSLIDSNWMRGLKIFLAAATLSLSVASPGSSLVSTNSQNQTIIKTIETLKQSDQRWIQVNLTKQRLIAWKGRTPVYAIAISSGKKSTPTRTGIFKIQSKFKTTRMRGKNYDVPNVPYVMFYQGSYGIHGAYWHRRFGTPVSHGCVNLAPNHAKWLFNWASIGTPIVIRK
jgi:lipoprotein-anchoring transpeptidase ErfK/SrfK